MAGNILVDTILMISNIFKFVLLIQMLKKDCHTVTQPYCTTIEHNWGSFFVILFVSNQFYSGLINNQQRALILCNSPKLRFIKPRLLIIIMCA